MTTLLLAFAFMLFMVAAMAIGVIFGRKPISGSCGGMKALGMEVECEICGGDPSVCETENGLTRRVLRAFGRTQPRDRASAEHVDQLARPAERSDRE